MSGYDPAAYGDAWAGAYDSLHRLPDTDTAVRTLADLAGGGRVLELGAGTGRLALPLAARGLDVHAVEASAAMIARLRGKPGGRDLPVTQGDLTDVRVAGGFSLVVLAFHTLFNLPTQELQVRCFANAAAHLVPGGRFAVEASVPHRVMVDGAETVRLGDGPAAPGEPAVQRHDPLAQRVDFAYLYLGGGEPVLLPVTIRYAWPSEVDLMARLAGMTLEARWSDWSRRPFTASSQRHVSVYRTAAPPGRRP